MIPKEHQMKCCNCGQIMDMRDLSQVFAHEECNGIPIDYKTMRQVEHTCGLRKLHIPEFSSPEFMAKYNRLLHLN